MSIFQKNLQDPKNIDALLGLAVLEFKNENYKKYYESLEKAYEIDRTSPFLLLHISEFFLLRKDYEKVFFLKICIFINTSFFQARLTAIKGYKALKNCPNFIIDPKNQNQMLERKKRKNDFYEAKSRFLYILGYYHHYRVNFNFFH